MFLQETSYPGGTTVLLWLLEDDERQLLAMCREQAIPADDLLDLPVKRQREKAVERLLLYKAFGLYVTLLHDKQGAPAVEGHERVNISITHTMGLVALALNDNCVIGLDAESCDRHQVLKVRDKYLNASEQQFITPGDLTAHVIAWTAKEAIIKAERNSAIDWTDGITLQPFVPSLDDTTLNACCGSKRYHLTSRRLLGHYLTVALPVAPQSHSAGQ